jgi:hypothetical protein
MRFPARPVTARGFWHEGDFASVVSNASLYRGKRRDNHSYEKHYKEKNENKKYKKKSNACIA